ncbi:molecular chaperone TorD family protein [Desulfurispirillum indicum]|uniref:TorD/DmsD family molecular chaperone n=1 Tax=Desulfurispirillum indicum TaxID=936456 RepID=UPI001CFABD13|nr:molecular chaperone TorD family protein [Desulfurispirillum indicum]UCZ57039.1 molecular chaperone TorD family protein [Desulfurispirillum indicum]
MGDSHVEIFEYAQYEAQRANGFKLLAALFYEPEKELFTSEKIFAQLTEIVKKVCPDELKFFTALEPALQNYHDQELLVEYAQLFVGPAELIAPPYGSVYLDEERQLMGDSTLEVIKIYRENGLSIDGSFKDAPDHIVAELEFMYYLLFQEAQYLQINDLQKAQNISLTQQMFLDNFLLPWLKPFCENILNGTDNEFYCALAKALRAYAESTHWTKQSPFE